MPYRQFAYYYDRLMEDTPYDDWLRFAKSCWKRFGYPATVADLGCGTGNIAIPLAQDGLHVTGIDLSEDMLAVAAGKTEALLGPASAFPSGGTVTWVRQDLRDWRLPAPVDCALSFCDCLNYLLEEEEIRRTMRQTYLGLKPGGLFLFDVHTPALLRNYAQEQPFVLNDEDIAYIWLCDFDETRCQIVHHLDIFVSCRDWTEGGGSRKIGKAGRPETGGHLFRRIRETHVQRAYPLDWLENELVQAGFHEVHVCADFSWHAPNERSERAFFVARRD